MEIRTDCEGMMAKEQFALLNRYGSYKTINAN